MDKNNILIIASALSLCSMLLFADNLEFVYASSVATITLPAGTPTQGVILQNGTTNRTFITALVSGEVNVYVKGTNVDVITSTLVLSGTSSGGAIVHNTFNNEIVVITNLGIHRIDPNTNSVIQFFSDTTFNGVNMAIYDATEHRIYAYEVSASSIYSIDASNISSYQTWNDASMTGLNVFFNTGVGAFTLDYNDGIIFVAGACTSGGVLKIDNLDGTWNESACVDVAGAFTNYGIGVDMEDDKVLVSLSDNAQVKITNYALSTLVTATVDTVPRNIAVSSETHRAYIQHSTLDQVTILSTVDGSNIAELAVCDNPILLMSYQNVKDLSDNTIVFIPCFTGQDVSMLTDTSGSSGGNIINGVDCDDPLKAQTLLCRSQSTTGVSLPSQLLNQSSTTIFCQTGIIQCTDNGNGGFTPVNPDSKTNGVGFIMTLIALGIMVGILWVASRGDLSNIPTFVWFIATISILGAMTALQYIDPTFLIIGVVSIVGFAVAKAKGIFSGGAVFNGEGS